MGDEEEEEEIDEDEDTEDDEVESDEDDGEEDVSDSSSEDEEEEEAPRIPTPEEVDLEYTYPQDFQGRSWQDVVQRRYFRLILHPSCTGIPSSKFRYCNYLIEIVFAETSSGLTEIGAWAFEDCLNLQRMTDFPVGLLRLRPSAYSGCRALSGVLVFPGTVVLVDEYCFHHCSAVTRVVFRDPRTTPAATTPVELGRFVFKMCSALQSAQL